MAGCDLRALWSRPAAIPELHHNGYRKDIPSAARGNAVFTGAQFSDDGALIVTTHHNDPKMRVWDAKTGKLISSFTASPADDVWMIDAGHRRFVGRTHGNPNLVVFDLMSGRIVSEIPDRSENRAFPLGLTDDDTAVVLAKPGMIEVWNLVPPTLIRSAENPLPVDAYRPACVGGVPATYNDKKCWELSPGKRWLAMAFTPVPSVGASSIFYLIDLQTLMMRQLVLPDGQTGKNVSAFAFSADERVLAFGTDRGVWFYEISSNRWGPFVAGDHRRNAYLGAMRFSDDGKRLVTLGDQLQTSVFDTTTGSRLGRMEPAEWDREGVFRVSRDGSRIVIYHFVSDVLEVLDAQNAQRIGWVCPYFCNLKHNPVEVPYAVSPDGKAVAASQRAGSGVWETDTDRLLFPLNDPSMPPLKD